MKNEKKTREEKRQSRIDNRHLILCIIFAVLFLISYQGYLHVKTFRPGWVELRQYAGAFSVIFSVLAVLHFFRMFRSGVMKKVAGAIGKTVGRLIDKLSGMVSVAAAKLRRAMGLPERKARSQDEKSFVWGSRRAGRKKEEFAITGLKWKNLTNDSERIRFLYVRFVKKKTRAGMRYSVCRTPNEIGSEWKLPEKDGGEIFGEYTEARYRDEGYTAGADKLKKYSGLAGVNIRQ